MKYSPWTFTKILPANNLSYVYAVTIAEIRDHYNDQSIIAKEVCCCIINGDYDACMLAVQAVADQQGTYIAFLNGTLNVPMRLNCTVTVNR